ncbi:hypothetical protein DEJ45_04575 [Streptomyces venezuelae]|uniref:hypothetical protein n=1 Tax=Streptomyces venezuelae TaxID=54571 RepID=UPI00123D22FE|nr:hypothetical protein [Streptomyces venezuelae]QES11750.1 hypothetical protein DEJ45_04575 [Streptomyces venezuelae]
MRHHPFPDDLVLAREAWTRTYAELARPRTSRAAGVTALRRRLIRLSAGVYFPPYWARPRPAADRADLLRQVRDAQRARGEVAA